jgi:hypothetical protein
MVIEQDVKGNKISPPSRAWLERDDEQRLPP